MEGAFQKAEIQQAQGLPGLAQDLWLLDVLQVAGTAETQPH